MFFTWILHLMFSPFVPDGLILGPIARFILAIFLYPVALLILGYLLQEGFLGEEEWVTSLPIIGRLYVFVFNPQTYYRQDTAMMFRDSIRSAVNEVLGELREEKGLRLLGEGELRPDAGEDAATA